MIASADVPGISGTVVEKAALGLPAIPSTGDSGPSGLTGLLSGTHSLRVWDGGPRQLRVQVLDQLDETEVVVNGTDAWTYTYSTNRATHLTLPPAQQAGANTDTTPSAGSLTPEQLATQVLAAINPTTQVSVTGTASVAGHDAYTLNVSPRTSATTVGQIAIDVDAATGVPLRVRIYARGATSAALSVGFSQVSFAAVPASRFAFTPPPAAHVSTGNLPALPGHDRLSGPDSQATPQSQAGSPTQSNAQPYTVGSGWSSVLVLPNNPLTAARMSGGRDSQARAFANAIAKAGQPVQGGTLVSSALVNVLLTDDGRMLIGAVPASALEAAATAPAPTR